ncbi:MerR family transcriptional regulator [Bacillus carboniphilus]|uniref:MerR family transcriptional regulator n=1 Tax=Bacillus carboniphilus TaxID=86663 RepID=A0ABY9JUL4_9BACI|nr:MerR family transcriptional regulator [Bacillus carboniphilus]WLR43091.1 MerR family transcriptional regulator [Bacillus carboniphilus]
MEDSYKLKKVISIGTVSEITGLSVRQIRYYEERNLVEPDRTSKGTRKYSFSDIEQLMIIANQREEGVQTTEILRELRKQGSNQSVRNNMIRGQINAQFNKKN